MSYHDEQRRRFDEAPVDRRAPPDSGMSWGLPLGLAGVAIVLGLIFYNANHERTTTASNSPGTAQSTSSTPAPSAPSTQPARPQAPSK
jgi:hypothetical protein